MEEEASSDAHTCDPRACGSRCPWGLGTRAPSGQLALVWTLCLQSLPIWSGKFSKNTEMWNSELRTMGRREWKDQGEMRAGKALQAEAGLDQGTEEKRELSWGAVWWQFIQVINLDRVPAGYLVLKTVETP